MPSEIEWLLLYKRPLHHKVARRGGVAFLEVTVFQQGFQAFQHLWAAAQHDAIGFGVERGQTQVRK